MPGAGFIDLTPQFLKENERALSGAMQRMTIDITMLAKRNVPRKSYTLVKKIEWFKLGVFHYRILVDTPYAMYQEKGQRRDGTHVVRRYTTPNTGKGYLQRAAETVLADSLGYLKRAIHSTITV